MKLRIERSPFYSRLKSIAVMFTSIILALALVAVIFYLYGVNPLIAYGKIFRGAFGSPYAWSETMVKAIPLLLCGLGLAVAFKAIIWNIGAEGQLLIGAIMATWIALSFPDIPSTLLIPLMFALGFLGGAIWGLIPGLLKAKLGVDEIITTLMMNYIADNLLKHLVYGPWKGSEEWGFPYTNKFSYSAQLPRIPGTRIHYPTLLIGLILTVSIYVLLMKSKWGYEIRVVGESREAARYAGISFTKIVLLVMVVSGGLAGLAGVGEVAGIQHRLRVGVSPGYGYTAIIVAWLGRLHPLGVLASSILFGGLMVGGDMIQVAMGLPFSVINIFNGLILLFIIGGEILIRYRVILTR